MNHMETILEATPVFPAAPAVTGSFFELILRQPRRLDRLLRDEGQLFPAIQQLLLLAVVGLAAHGLAMGIAAQALGRGHCDTLGAFWARGNPALWMPLAMVGAFLGALCICLPSFYFYTQLAGLDASFRQVTALALRGQAVSSVMLLGTLPVFVATALARGAGVAFTGDGVMLFGALLPFLVGLTGIHALYRGFVGLAEQLPPTHLRRGHYLRRMMLCWVAIFAVISPIALARLFDALGSWL